MVVAAMGIKEVLTFESQFKLQRKDLDCPKSVTTFTIDAIGPYGDCFGGTRLSTPDGRVLWLIT